MISWENNNKILLACPRRNTLTHRQSGQYGDYQEEMGWGEVGEGKGGINGDRRLDLGW